MNRRFAFDGFEELIRRPLADADRHSYRRITRTLQREHTGHAAPFALLVRKLVGRRLAPSEARDAWEQIIALKHDMETALGRTIDIQTAAVEHFAMQERSSDSAAKPMGGTQGARRKLLGSRHIDPHAPDYHLARLKDEMQRSRRYSHALSAIVMDSGPLPVRLDTDADEAAESALAAVVRIVERTIRAVDILAPCGTNRLLVILPDTNQREASELADRIKTSVSERTGRMPLFTRAVDVAIAAAQCEEDDTAAGFVRTLEASLPDKEGGD